MQAQFDSNRGFGVEIETARTYGHSPRSIAAALTDAGIPTNATHGHSTQRTWKVVPDASTGSEIVSPILYGQDGLDQISAVCAVLRTIGLRVDSSTGLHVHHDGRDLTRRQYASAMYLYAKAEEFVAALLPTRAHAFYCRPLSLEVLATNYQRFVRTDADKYRMSGCDCGIYRSHYCNHRYYATNPTNAAASGTLEFRQHSGSLNATKITSWVVFTQGFINAGIARNVSTTPINSQDPLAEKLFRAMGRDTHCEVTKSARRNIVQRVFTNDPSFYLGRAARYLTTAQRRAHRAAHPGTRAQHRAAAQQVADIEAAASSRYWGEDVRVTALSAAEQIASSLSSHPSEAELIEARAAIYSVTPFRSRS